LQGNTRADHLAWLVEEGFVPAYFSGIEARLNSLKETFTTASEPIGTFRIGGGTDLLVQKPESVRHAGLQPLFDDPALRNIEVSDGQLHIGASVTVAQFAENEHVRRAFPELDKIVKLVSSTPIRNMATIAGNLVNASPIGDMSVFFLALNATLTLNSGGERRQIPLKDFFQAYKKTALQPGDIMERISFTPPAAGSFFHFEKVCKRTHLDIASVNTACQMVFAPDGSLAEVHLSAGGVWPFPKYLEKTAAFLRGKKTAEALWTEAEPILQSEIAPISDVRGSETYKRLLLSKLFLAHLIEYTQI
jgi:xanthine dehydrogenase small subunit